MILILEMIGPSRRSAGNECERCILESRSSRNYADRGSFYKKKRKTHLSFYFKDLQHMLRSRMDYYNRIQPNHDNVRSFFSSPLRIILSS